MVVGGQCLKGRSSPVLQQQQPTTAAEVGLERAVGEGDKQEAPLLLVLRWRWRFARLLLFLQMSVCVEDGGRGQGG